MGSCAGRPMWEAPTRARGQARYWAAPSPGRVRLPAIRSSADRCTSTSALREPLVPDDDATWVEPVEGHDGIGFVDEEGDEVQVIRTWTVDRRLMLSVQEPIDEVLDDLAAGELPQRGLVIVGDIDDPEDAAAAVELAESCGWPLHSEPSGQARAGLVAVAHASALAGSERFRAAHSPQLVVSGQGRTQPRPHGPDQCRRHPHSRRAAADDRLAGPTRTAICVLGSVPAPPADTQVPESSEWLDSWLMADAGAKRAIEKILDSAPQPTSLHAARALWKVAESDDLLFVASSRSIRDLELVADARPMPRVMANRGVNGIDGIVSTAMGAALAHQSEGGGQAFVMLGDLALLHDQNGLIIGPEEPRPDLCLLVVDNGGGGIFGSLEQADPAYSDVYERVFGTPVGVDIRALMKASGVTLHDGPDLDSALRQARQTPGISAVVVGPVSRQAEAELHAQIREALA